MNDTTDETIDKMLRESITGMFQSQERAIVFLASYVEWKIALYVIKKSLDAVVPVSLFVFGNRDLHKYICSLNRQRLGGKVDINYIPLNPVSGNTMGRILDVFKARVYWRRVYGKYLSGLAGMVYFFDRSMTPHFGYLLGKLNNKVSYFETQIF